LESEARIIRKEILSEWKKCQDKYNLPELEDIELKFRFTSRDQFFLIPATLGAMVSLLNWAGDILECIFTPSRMHHIVDSKAFTKEEKEKLHEMYKKVNKLNREALLAYLKSEKEKADMINLIYQFYEKELHKFLLELFEKTSKAWTKDKKIESMEYMG
jgi:hypothetical protein